MTLLIRRRAVRAQLPGESRRLRVYLAAPFELQAPAAVLRGDLDKRHGIGCTSRWLDAKDRQETNGWARRCLSDVEAADVLVALNPESWGRAGTGGRHVELGYALALRKPVLVVGARTNLFHFLLDVTVVEVPPGGAVRAADIVPVVQRLALLEGRRR